MVPLHQSAHSLLNSSFSVPVSVCLSFLQSLAASAVFQDLAALDGHGSHWRVFLSLADFVKHDDFSVPSISWKYYNLPLSPSLRKDLTM